MRQRHHANLSRQHRAQLVQSVALAPGGGKSHLAVRLAVSACWAGYFTYFTSLDDMVRHLQAADEVGRPNRKMRTYMTRRPRTRTK